jgi:hypothetical protein
MLDFTNVIQNIVATGYPVGQALFNALFPLVAFLIGISLVGIILKAVIDFISGLFPTAVSREDDEEYVKGADYPDRGTYRSSKGKGVSKEFQEWLDSGHPSNRFFN